MKYTAKPVTQYARNKKAAMSPFKAEDPPAKDHNALENISENASSNSKTSIQRQGGKLYEVTTNNESQSNAGEADKSVTVDKAIAGGTPGTPWEKSMQRRIKEGATDVQLVDAGHGTLEGLNKKFKKDFDSQRASKEKGNSKSSSTTVKPVMTKAEDAESMTQTRSYQKARQNRQWIRSNAVNRIAASSQVRRAKKDGMFADGELTDKGRSSLSPEQQKGLSSAYDTKRGRSADQLAHANRTGKWAHGGNTAVGESFETKAAKASEHATATGSEQEYTGDVSSTSASSSSNNSSSSSKSSAQGTNTKNNNTISIQRPVFNEPLDGIEGPTLEGALGIGKYKMNRLHSSKSPAKMWNTDASPAKEGETVREHSPAGEAKMKKADKAAKDARWAAASPAKQQKPTKDYLANTAPGTVDNRPASLRQKYAEQEKREATPSWQAKFNPKEGGKISATKAKSPAKMWGPSKVKAGKNGFNR